ncbi:MAG: hypothetical protein LBI10_06590 [Deltaproteobacteria bacterium]|jgi:hypothetical protein|nr:hypothetical protein [Deltaproteobacteria bacterium]
MATSPHTLALGCVEPVSGLYRRDHFLIALNYELKRLGACQAALGLIVIGFPKNPNWSQVGAEIQLLLGGCDQAGRVGAKEAAILLPETGERPVTRLLGELGRELGPAKAGLALAWPGQTVTALGLIAAAREKMSDFSETLKRIAGVDGPWAKKETAIAPAERESLFMGFGALIA